MKSTFKTALLALTGVAFLANPATGAVSLSSGDLAVAFYEVIAGVVQPNTYVFDLGTAAAYRENSTYNVSISTIGGVASNSIGPDLVTAFGADWFSSGTVRWTVIGGTKSTGGAVSLDPTRTNYISATRDDMNVATTIPTLISGQNGTLNTQATTSFYDGVNGAAQTVGANPAGSFIDKSAINSIEDFLPPVQSLTWGIALPDSPIQVFGGGTVGNSTLEGALDIYRILHTTSGADLTAGLSNGDAAQLTGQYIGTLTIDSAGGLSIVPEPSAALLGLLGAAGACFRRRRSA